MAVPLNNRSVLWKHMQFTAPMSLARIQNTGSGGSTAIVINQSSILCKNFHLQTKNRIHLIIQSCVFATLLLYAFMGFALFVCCVVCFFLLCLMLVVAYLFIFLSVVRFRSPFYMHTLSLFRSLSLARKKWFPVAESSESFRFVLFHFCKINHRCVLLLAKSMIRFGWICSKI